ncbi:MAG: hypothetical protein F6K26_47485, partial [Moorea sp. SIO2I5]|nr:hypothetical protein [Moorena sp. SIO2I5]
ALPSITPYNDIFGVIEGRAVSVALWLRKNYLKSINYQDEFEQLLKCKINELPKNVIEKRSEAFSNAKNKKEHIGHHIALLWEDPYLLPTQIIDDIIYTTL